MLATHKMLQTKIDAIHVNFDFTVSRQSIKNCKKKIHPWFHLHENLGTLFIPDVPEYFACSGNLYSGLFQFFQDRNIFLPLLQCWIQGTGGYLSGTHIARGHVIINSDDGDAADDGDAGDDADADTDAVAAADHKIIRTKNNTTMTGNRP